MNLLFYILTDSDPGVESQRRCNNVMLLYITARWTQVSKSLFIITVLLLLIIVENPRKTGLITNQITPSGDSRCQNAQD